jgi:hypothetical protein
MFCQNCGKEITQDTRFCGYCGHDQSPSQPTPPTTVSKKEQKFEFSQLHPITLIYVGILSIFTVIGTFGIGLIGIAIWYFVSVYAINNMTYKVKGSVNWAFAIIMTFGIFGYICYWIWFLNRRNSMVDTA